MIRRSLSLALASGALLLAISCAPVITPFPESAGAMPAAELPSAEGALPIPGFSAPRFAEAGHRSMTELAARAWGLAPSRVANLADASDDPDTYQSGLDNYYNQQWSHAYLWNSLGTWNWGDADDDYHDNLDGGSEGYDGKSAAYWYALGDQYRGDRHVGYSCHYIEDVSFVLHSSFPGPLSLTMLSKHFAFEDWMKNNWSTGWRLMDAVAADGYYYPVTDTKAAIRSASWQSCAWSGGDGAKAWEAYKAAGYPTASGSGTATLASWVGKMVVHAGRWAKGTVKYAMDKWGQWAAGY